MRQKEPTFEDVIAAHHLIQPFIHRTPVLTNTYLDQLSGASLFFKCESFQKTGAFKARGATNAVFQIDEKQAQNGVITHSSGNHAAALAYAAQNRAIATQIVMPQTAIETKKQAVREYGGSIHECAPSAKARDEAVQALIEKTGAEFIPPYNDTRVIAGQGTCAKEMLEDIEDLDAIIAPIGGGGLISGTCISAKALSPKVDVFAAEPEQADDAYRSFKAGHLIKDDAPQTIADGLKAPLGPLTWHIVSHHVHNILTASETEIVNAMLMVWQRMKILIEPSSAVALAVVLKNRDIFKGRRTGIILTGGNVDLWALPWLHS